MRILGIIKNSYINVICQSPVSSFGYSDSSLTVYFSDSSINFTNLSWDFGDGNMDTVQNPTHTYSDAGTYTVTLIVSNSCGSDTDIQTVTVQSTGINQYKYIGEPPIIYPNPANEHLYILLNQHFNFSCYFTLYNLLGETIIQENQLKRFPAMVNIGNLIPGFYITEITINNIVYNHKLLITSKI